MVKQILFLISIVAVLAGCNSNEKPVVLRKESHKVVSPQSKVQPNRILSINIDGMTCMMGCGASIRKELYQTNAVRSVEFDFEEGRKTNNAKIAFNKDQITVDQIVKILTTMNEKQFTVGEMSSEDYIDQKSKGTNSTDEKSSSKSENSTIKTSESKIEIPNFLDLLSQFITRGLFRKQNF